MNFYLFAILHYEPCVHIPIPMKHSKICHQPITMTENETCSVQLHRDGSILIQLEKPTLVQSRSLMCLHGKTWKLHSSWPDRKWGKKKERKKRSLNCVNSPGDRNVNCSNTRGYPRVQVLQPPYVTVAPNQVPSIHWFSSDLMLAPVVSYRITPTTFCFFCPMNTARSRCYYRRSNQFTYMQCPRRKIFRISDSVFSAIHPSHWWNGVMVPGHRHHFNRPSRPNHSKTFIIYVSPQHSISKENVSHQHNYQIKKITPI